MEQPDDKDVVEGLYSAALGQQSWDEAAFRLKQALDGHTLMLSVLNARTSTTEVATSYGLSAESLKMYEEHYAPHDLWVREALAQRLYGRALVGAQLVDEHVLQNSLFYSEWLRHQYIFRLTGAMFSLHGGAFGIIGVQRPRDAKDFTPSDIHRLNLLLPHLRRALEIRQRLARAEAASSVALATFDRLRMGVVLMDPTGWLLHANVAAEAILRAGDGLFRTPGGIHAAIKADDRRLQALIAEAGRTSESMAMSHVPGGHVRVSRPSGRQPYAIMVAPVGSGLTRFGKRTAAVLLFITDPSEELTSDLAILRDTFGFPTAEARMVLALLNGVPPPDFARKAGLSYHTVRTLLSRAMARTETRSQVELVLLVARSLAGVATNSPPVP
jgi:DNA-binding CsgD family transcriptional regulator